MVVNRLENQPNTPIDSVKHGFYTCHFSSFGDHGNIYLKCFIRDGHYKCHQRLTVAIYPIMQFSSVLAPSRSWKRCCLVETDLMYSLLLHETEFQKTCTRFDYSCNQRLIR